MCTTLLTPSPFYFLASLLDSHLGVFEAVLIAVQQLSDAVQEELTPHIGALLIQINKKVFNRKYASQIQNTLAVCSEKYFVVSLCLYP